MKTLDQHNAEQDELRRLLDENKHKAGVGCPKCGVEMRVEDPGVMNASFPPSQWVRCPSCDHRDLKR